METEKDWKADQKQQQKKHHKQKKETKPIKKTKSEQKAKQDLDVMLNKNIANLSFQTKEILMKIQLTSKQKIWEGNTEKQAENEEKKKKANKNKRWTRKKIQNK